MIKTFKFVLDQLNSANIPYMVVGSVASTAYGEPRLTRDMDLVIEVPVGLASKIGHLFSAPEFYCPPSEIIIQEVQQRGQFNLLHVGSGLKIDLMVRKDTPHAKEEFSRRRKITLFPNYEAYLASPEDIIIKKLQYYRDGRSQKHLTDIRGILGQTPIDTVYLQGWLANLGLNNEWKLVEE